MVVNVISRATVILIKHFSSPSPCLKRLWWWKGRKTEEWFNFRVIFPPRKSQRNKKMICSGESVNVSWLTVRVHERTGKRRRRKVSTTTTNASFVIFLRCYPMCFLFFFWHSEDKMVFGASKNRTLEHQADEMWYEHERKSQTSNER